MKARRRIKKAALKLLIIIKGLIIELKHFKVTFLLARRS
jgi:hypothetical protein